MSTSAEILKAARDLIADPDSWTQGAYARTVRGNVIGLNESPAACFCSIGAIAKVAGTDLANPVPYQVREAFQHVGIRSSIDLVEFNDNHTHSEVLALFDRAIAVAEARP